MSRLFSSILHRFVLVGSVIAVIGSLHSIINLRILRQPAKSELISEPISILLPVLNEADRITPTLLSLLNQQNISNLELIIRDDGSSDQTVELIKHLTRKAQFPIRIITEDEIAPEGWISKSWSCYRMSELATGSVLVFTDADVVFSQTALSQAVATLRKLDLDLISPYPRQIAITWSERLIQPLLQWSFLTFLPLSWAEKSRNPALSAANGQFIVVDKGSYQNSGGHSANPGAVLDDIALLKSIKKYGGRGVVIDGTELAKTRMYRNFEELSNGYSKSLWSAMGGKKQSRTLSFLLTLAYVIPPIAALSKGSIRLQRIGAIGYLAAILSRYLISIKTKSRKFPDVITHPISILGYVALTELSWYRKIRNQLHWRGKKLP